VTPEEIAQIDEQLRVWRQGDVVLTEAIPAVHLAHMASPGTAASKELAAILAEGGIPPDFATVSLDAAGFMVVSQTCDIVRGCGDRPYVEVCPLQPFSADKMPLVRLGRVPRYAWVKGLGEANLVADLELVTTLEKAALVRFGADRQPGAATEAEARSLREALGRKRSRAAFPDDFNSFIAPLQERVITRHNRNSAEGGFLKAVREIRVIARPSWNAQAIEVELLFLFETARQIPPDADTQMTALLERLTQKGPYVSIDARAVGLDALSAAAYVGSDRLDLEHLSTTGI